MEWIKFSDQRPKDGERCLVCDKHFKDVYIMMYNGHHECWDDENGDDYYCDFDRIDYWMPLPEYHQ